MTLKGHSKTDCLSCSLSLIELIINAYCKDQQNDDRKDEGHIPSHPLLHLHALTGIHLFQVIIKPPTISCYTEQQINKGTYGQKNVAHQKVLQIQNGSAKGFQPAEGPFAKSQDTGHGQ